MGGGDAWFVVCMGGGVEKKFMVVCETTNGRWGLIRHDELGDMGHLVPMRKMVYYEYKHHFQKVLLTTIQGILNLGNQPHENQMGQKQKGKKLFKVPWLRCYVNAKP
jgi:hypothetical protein